MFIPKEMGKISGKFRGVIVPSSGHVCAAPRRLVQAGERKACV